MPSKRCLPMRTPEFWSRDDFAARLALATLAPFGWLYGASVAFKRDHATPWRARANVICVGNLTAGGSGKTPVAITLARALLERGLRVVFLSRGYRGKLKGPVIVKPDVHDSRSVGDEPLLLAKVATTIVAADRRAGAMLADSLGADILLMDDGHQNFALTKDLSIVVTDGEAGFGNGKVLPAGPLREPAAQGLARADAVVIVGEGTPPLDGFGGSVLRARLIPDSENFDRKRLVAFAGIGRPSKFFDMLERMGAELIVRRSFPDHHVYTRPEITDLNAEARRARALLVTTEKDFVRLSPEERPGIHALPIRAKFASPESVQELIARFCNVDA